jgi:riboflavin kinase/FMN adenylyltransferase
MKLLHGLDDTGGPGGIVAIGNFDGVHRGHAAMLARLVERARATGVASVVFTFDPHPMAVLRPAQAPPPLSTLEARVAQFERAGVDQAIIYATDRALLDLTAKEFFDRVIVGTLKARGLVEGPNFYFGRDRQGNVALLRHFCDAAGLTFDVVPPVLIDGLLVSSTQVRQLVAAGSVARAALLLGRNYAVCGTVEVGARRGRLLGFPTANLERVATLLPAAGVYAGLCLVDAEWHPCAINLGPNPTFAEQRQKLEVHILDFSGELYGRKLEVAFVDRLRDVRAFQDASALAAQLADDVARVRLLALRAAQR